jgi:hypothetical protein
VLNSFPLPIWILFLLLKVDLDYFESSPDPITKPQFPHIVITPKSKALVAISPPIPSRLPTTPARGFIGLDPITKGSAETDASAVPAIDSVLRPRQRPVSDDP